MFDSISKTDSQNLNSKETLLSHIPVMSVSNSRRSVEETEFFHTAEILSAINEMNGCFLIVNPDGIRLNLLQLSRKHKCKLYEHT